MLVVPHWCLFARSPATRALHRALSRLPGQFGATGAPGSGLDVGFVLPPDWRAESLKKLKIWLTQALVRLCDTVLDRGLQTEISPPPGESILSWAQAPPGPSTALQRSGPSRIVSWEAFLCTVSEMLSAITPGCL
jgi:hypothetical protein